MNLLRRWLDIIIWSFLNSAIFIDEISYVTAGLCWILSLFLFNFALIAPILKPLFRDFFSYKAESGGRGEGEEMSGEYLFFIRFLAFSLLVMPISMHQHDYEA